MATLDTTGLAAVKFAVDTAQTVTGGAFTHFAGDVVCIPDDIDSITVDVLNPVACMSSFSHTGDVQSVSNRLQGRNP